MITKSLLKIVPALVIVAQITSCNSAQSEAQQQADLIEKTMKEASHRVTTSESRTYMTAKIDGKEWSATAMIPDNNASGNTKLVRGERGKDMIQFQLYKPRNVVGKKVSFGDGYSAGIYIGSNPALLSGNSGELEITKIDNEWIEGIFHFTATGIIYDAAGNSSPKTVEVTDGRFRVQNR